MAKKEKEENNDIRLSNMPLELIKTIKQMAKKEKRTVNKQAEYMLEQFVKQVKK